MFISVDDKLQFSLIAILIRINLVSYFNTVFFSNDSMMEMGYNHLQDDRILGDEKKEH